jgi:hypothetical protein
MDIVAHWVGRCKDGALVEMPEGLRQLEVCLPLEATQGSAHVPCAASASCTVISKVYARPAADNCATLLWNHVCLIRQPKGYNS